MQGCSQEYGEMVGWCRRRDWIQICCSMKLSWWGLKANSSRRWRYIYSRNLSWPWIKASLKMQEWSCRRMNETDGDKGRAKEKTWQFPLSTGPQSDTQGPEFTMKAPRVSDEERWLVLVLTLVKSIYGRTLRGRKSCKKKGNKRTPALYQLAMEPEPK